MDKGFLTHEKRSKLAKMAGQVRLAQRLSRLTLLLGRENPIFFNHFLLCLFHILHYQIFISRGSNEMIA